MLNGTPPNMRCLAETVAATKYLLHVAAVIHVVDVHSIPEACGSVVLIEVRGAWDSGKNDGHHMVRCI